MGYGKVLAAFCGASEGGGNTGPGLGSTLGTPSCDISLLTTWAESPSGKDHPHCQNSERQCWKPFDPQFPALSCYR